MNSIVQRWNADCSVTGKTLDNRFPQLVIGLLRDCVVRYQTIVVHPPRSNLRGDFLSSSFCQKGITAEQNCSLNTAVNTHCDNAQVGVDAPSPSKAHVQTWRHGVTSGAQDFENVEKFGHRYLNRADSKNHPAKDSESKHNSVTHQACPSVRSLGRQVERGCCDCAKLKATLRGGKVLFRVPFPYRPTVSVKQS